MIIPEYEAKELLKEYGLCIPVVCKNHPGLSDRKMRQNQAKILQRRSPLRFLIE